MAYGFCSRYDLSVELFTGQIFIGPELCEESTVLNAREQVGAGGRGVFTLKTLTS